MNVFMQQLWLQLKAPGNKTQAVRTGNGTVSTGLSGDDLEYGRLSWLALFLAESSAAARTAAEWQAGVMHSLQTVLVYVHLAVFNQNNFFSSFWLKGKLNH